MSRSQPQQQRKQPITDRNHVLTFGKYKGESVASILDSDPGYLVWIHENTSFEMSSELFDEAYADYDNNEWSKVLRDADKVDNELLRVMKKATGTLDDFIGE